MTLSGDLEFLSNELEKLRFVGLDQNPKGIRDLLGAASSKAKRHEEAYAFAEMLRDLWSNAEDACEKGGHVEEHVQKAVNAYCGNHDSTPATLADFVIKVGREANKILAPKPTLPARAWVEAAERWRTGNMDAKRHWLTVNGWAWAWADRQFDTLIDRVRERWEMDSRP